MSTKAPSQARDVFELLADYACMDSLDLLLDQFNWKDVTPHQVYWAFLGRLPESAKLTRRPKTYDAQKHARDVLLSKEFRSAVIPRLLNAFPEKQRIIHIHIPKTAGTDLRDHLAERYPYIHPGLLDRDNEAFLKWLATFIARVKAASAVLVTGHIPLRWYFQHSLYRFGDQIFSVCRDPYQSLISLTNYYLNLIEKDPNCISVDTQKLGKMLGVKKFDAVMSNDQRLSLGRRILNHEGLMGEGLLTYYLADSTASSALELMARCNIELTHMGQYERWLDERWQIKKSRHANTSPQVLEEEDLDESEKRFLKDFCQEDTKVYEKIVTQIERSGRSSVFGSELI